MQIFVYFRKYHSVNDGLNIYLEVLNNLFGSQCELSWLIHPQNENCGIHSNLPNFCISHSFHIFRGGVETD